MRGIPASHPENRRDGYRAHVAAEPETGIITDAALKPKPLQAPVEGGFTVDDFTVDEQAGTVSCPAGNTRPISRTRVASFGALCRDCPLRGQCTKSKTGRKIVLHQRDDLLRQARP